MGLAARLSAARNVAPSSRLPEQERGLPKNMERNTGFEPATFGLGSHCSTVELIPLYETIVRGKSEEGKDLGD